MLDPLIDGSVFCDYFIFSDTSAIESEIAADLRLINNLSKIKDYRDAEIRYLRQKLNALHERYTYLGNILEE